MSGRDQLELDAVTVELLAVGGRLGLTAEAFAVTGLHDRQGLGRGDHHAVAGAGVVGVAVGDHRPVHRPHRIDEEIAGRAIESLGLGTEHRFRLHSTAFHRSLN